MVAKTATKKDNLISWDDTPESRTSAMSRFSETQDSYDSIQKSHSNYYSDFLDIESNKSVRPGFTSSDYYSFRPEEAIPTRHKRIIKMCMEAYDKVGIVRNVIDLMGDFGSQGINIVHENKSVEDFFQQWFKKVDGKERSERFLNNLYRAGNVFIYRSSAKITPTIEKYLKSLGAEDVDVNIPDVKKNTVPWRYNFFNPLTVEIKNGALNLFLGNTQSIEVGGTFFGSFNQDDIPTPTLDTFPADIRRAILNKEKKIPIDPERLHISYYKKDDWKLWADPMTYSILDDIVMLQKMRLADMSALDGAISNIRLWTLGDFEHKVLPTKTGINKLRNILASNVGGGTMELVWGPELKYTESNSQVYKFLGSEKYQSVLNAIYAGLGVPPSLTGMSGNGGGLTNNFISLKTLVERLQYGREQLLKFWEKEVEIVRRAMGFRKSAKIIFDQMSLSDENAEKNLLIELVDRDIISQETLLERFKEVPSIEMIRLQREEKNRKSEKLPAKLGPYPSAVPAPSVKPDGTPHQTVIEGNGRPKFKQDSVPRKKRVDKPRSKPGSKTSKISGEEGASLAEFLVWSQNAYHDISELLNTAYLGTNNKSNLRQLTKSQVVELEGLKVDVLCGVELMEKVTAESVNDVLKCDKLAPLEFREHLLANKINTTDMTMEDYKKNIVGAFVEFMLT